MIKPITTSELETKLRAGSAGVLLFYGEEEYLKRHWLNRFRQAIVGDDAFSVFNHVVISKGDIDALEGELTALPMLNAFGQGLRLIELRDTNFDKMSKSDLSSLCALLSDPGENLVIIYTLPSELSEGTKKKPSAALLALSEVCTPVNFERQSPAKLVSWLSRHFASYGCTADPDTCRYMIEYCSADMFILSSEAEKLCAYTLTHNGKVINEDTVRQVCSRSKVFGAFDFADALLRPDVPAAITILSDMIKKREKPEEIMGKLCSTYSQLLVIRALSEAGLDKKEIASELELNEYVVSTRLRSSLAKSGGAIERVLELCTEADRTIKSQPVNKYYVIEELILKCAAL